MTTPAVTNTVDSDWVRMPDNTVLYTRTWISQRDPCATVLFVHGLGEHIARYDNLFQAFSNAGISVYGYDQRGSGRTGRRFDKGAVLGHGEGMEKTLEDIDEMLQRTKMASVPQFLMGQSMGGCVVLNYAVRGANKLGLAGVVATAPFLDFTMPQPRTKVAALLAIAKVAPSFIIHTHIPPEHISHNPQVNRQYEADWLVHDLVSLQTISEAYQSGRTLVKEDYKHVRVPVYLAHGTADRITSYLATKELCEKIKDITDTTFDTYEGGYHELYNEPSPDAERCLQKMIRWILGKAKQHEEHGVSLVRHDGSHFRYRG